MKIKETKNYFGKLYSLSEKLYLGNAVVVVRYEYSIPKYFWIYLNKDELVNLSLMKSLGFSKTPFILKSDFEDIYVFSKHSSSTIPEIEDSKTSSFSGDVKKIVSIKRKHYEGRNTENSNAEIFIGYSPINFLQEHLHSFSYYAFQKMYNVNEISKKYEIKLPDVKEDFKYSMWVKTYDNKDNMDLIYRPYHMFSYNFSHVLSNEELVDKVSEEIESLTMIIRILSNQNNSIEYIFINTNILGKKYRIEVLYNYDYSELLDSSYNMIKVEDYMKLINFMYKNYTEFDDKTKFYFNVITHRLKHVKNQNDVSLQIALLHVAFIQSIKYFFKGFVGISNEKKNKHFQKY